ncbi:MAG: hypothetical protein BGN87_00030 [Rhizobiales bacterium 65-79]|nr:MAG: hypothetical protein BGN87_00030 [Rhizobiales bacterium 65-79]
MLAVGSDQRYFCRMSETIQHFLSSGDTYEICCHACHHHAKLDMVKLRDRLGPDHGCLHDDIIHLFRCSKCGEKRQLGLLRTPRGNDKRGQGRAHSGSNLYAKAKGG